MSKEYQFQEGAYVNETDTRQYQVPVNGFFTGYYINETVVITPPATEGTPLRMMMGMGT